MPHSSVAILKTHPTSVINDYHELLNLGGYQNVVDRSVDTALKVNISWHFFFPAAPRRPGRWTG